MKSNPVESDDDRHDPLHITIRSMRSKCRKHRIISVSIYSYNSSIDTESINLSDMNPSVE
jgi:hypothetical protein